GREAKDQLAVLTGHQVVKGAQERGHLMRSGLRNNSEPIGPARAPITGASPDSSFIKDGSTVLTSGYRGTPHAWKPMKNRPTTSPAECADFSSERIPSPIASMPMRRPGPMPFRNAERTGVRSFTNTPAMVFIVAENSSPAIVAWRKNSDICACPWADLAHSR